MLPPTLACELSQGGVSAFPASGTGQALSKYLKEEGLQELNQASTNIDRDPEGTGAVARVCKGACQNCSGKVKASSCRTLNL